VVKTSEFLSCMLCEVFIAEDKDSVPVLANVLQKILILCFLDIQSYLLVSCKTSVSLLRLFVVDCMCRECICT